MQRKRKPLSQLAVDDQIIQEKRRKNGETSKSQQNHASHIKAGTISRMVLKNFMCHSHLEVTFNNNINFVIGRNGSGKSALLTALVVGLGGKASLTNRGNNIKGFIKAGKNVASVEITLRNEGPLSYRHSTYGDEITIVRNFTINGSSSYKVKSLSGEVISTQSREIKNLCTCLNIQIDNPVCLLNQDTSRNFLNTKDPGQKFILFMRATQLETLQEEYKKMFNNKKNATQMLKEKEVLYNNLRNTLKDLKEKMESHRSILNLKEQVILLQNEILWAKVRDAELETGKCEDEVMQIENECSELENQISNDSRKLSEIIEALQNLDQQIVDLRTAIGDQNAPQNRLVNALGDLKESINEKRREKRIILKDIAVKTGNCTILEQEIKKFTDNFAEMEQEKLVRMQEINDIENKIKGIQSLLETSKNDQFQLRNSINRLQETEHSLLTELRQTEIQIGSIRSRLHSLKNESNNTLSLYGQDMPKVIEAIKNDKRKFTHLPRGPLGSYITLKNKKWAIAVEGFLSSGLLRAFTVDNKKDNEILMNIFQKVWTSGSKPMVITSKFFFEAHNVSENMIQPFDDCLSVYSSLEISDPVVKNCLIDQTGMENVLLIPNTNKAIELMSDQRNVPRNCKQGITITGDKYFPDPNYKTYGSRYHNAQFLQVSTADLIHQLEAQLQELADKKTSAMNQHNSVKADFQEQSKDIIAMEIKITKLSKALVLLNRQRAELQNAVEPDVANVNVLENELSELKSLLENRKSVNEKIEVDINELKSKIQENEEQLERIKNIVRGYENRIEPIQQQIQNYQAERKRVEVNKRSINKRLGEYKNKMSLARSVLLGKRNVVKQKSEEASTSGERPDNIREVRLLVTELNSNQRAIRQIESDTEGPEEILRKYEGANQKYKQASEFMKSMYEDVKELQIAVEKCNQYYNHTKDYFVTFVKHSFQKVLELRQFQGNIDINIENKKLELIVIPQQGSQGITTTSNLSGGERSFSTVAFLYALWQCMEFPFYFLDEFDVFMDKVNRTKVMEILLSHAKSCPDLQFVFLTPQDVSSVNDKHVDIHRLEDPQRGLINK